MSTNSVECDFTKILLQNLHNNFRGDTETADVCFTFVMDDGKSEEKFLPAHKLILAGGSAVFQTMFYGGLKEGRNVPITDFSYDGFSEFINLFYLSNSTLSKNNILEVIRAVDKYDVRDSLPRCEQFLLAVTDESNACDVLEAAMKINLSPAITTKASDVIRKNAANIFRSNGFLLCDEKVLTKILQMDTLTCDNELTVFRAAMDWAGVRCREKEKPSTDITKRTELGQCFHLIRFTTMKAAEFLELHELYPEVFSYEEFSEILQHKLRGKPLKLLAELSSNSRIFENESSLSRDIPANNSVQFKSVRLTNSLTSRHVMQTTLKNMWYD